MRWTEDGMDFWAVSDVNPAISIPSPIISATEPDIA